MVIGWGCGGVVNCRAGVLRRNKFVIIMSQQTKPMNRICLKRKDTVKKPNTPGTESAYDADGVERATHESMTNSQISSVSYQQARQEENNRLFEEFKAQYDELRQQHEKLRKDHDDLVRDKRRMEIQLLNANPEYYQKEIKRLKGEVERLQEENEDYKHKYYVAENSKKEHESATKVKSEELKRIIQQLEKEKITVVEQKHQIVEKQKFYQRIISEMERSAETLSKSFEDANKKANKIESQLKAKQTELQNIQRAHEGVARQLVEAERCLKSSKEIFDQTNFKKTLMIDELESKLRNQNRMSKDMIDGLEVKIEQLSNQRKTENLLMNQRIESAASMKMNRMNELEVVRLEEINKELKQDIEAKNNIIKNLEEKLMASYPEEEYKELEAKYYELDKHIYESARQYEERLLESQKECEMLRMSQLRSPAEERGGNKEFQELLRNQVEQNSKMKNELSTKVNEIYNLKSTIQELRCKVKSGEDEIFLLNKRIKSQEKNYKIETDVSSQNLKNEIDSLKRKIETLNNKLENKVKDAKEKENFIVNSIVGRSRQEDAPLILAELQRIFETDYSSKLSAALLKIEQLEASR